MGRYKSSTKFPCGTKNTMVSVEASAKMKNSLLQDVFQQDPLDTLW